MTIQVLKKSLFEKNDQAAGQNRKLLAERKVVALNIMGGAGCGKTTLLEKVIPLLKARVRIGVLEGDLATVKDAARIDALGVPVIQLLTEGGCHLTATLVEQALGRLPLADLDLVLIENVGNPICPANFDLGEHARICVLSVAEGDDKPAKYPYLFKVADLVVITKTDLLAHLNFDVSAARQAIRVVNPSAPIVATSVQLAPTIQEVANWIQQRAADGDQRARLPQPESCPC